MGLLEEPHEAQVVGFVQCHQLWSFTKIRAGMSRHSHLGIPFQMFTVTIFRSASEMGLTADRRDSIKVQ